MAVTSFGAPSRSYYKTPAFRRHACVVLEATKRRGAAGRSSKSGFGKEKQPAEPSPTKNQSTASGDIYSLPALYDLAFGYRNYQEEVDFLLNAHKMHSSSQTAPSRILEFAAGPARHSLTALQGSSVQSVTAVDVSTEMVQYATELADEQLSNEKRDSFTYLCHDMRQFESKQDFDSIWILLGSLQHMRTNDDVISCFQSAYKSLVPGGTLVLELPHPRETFAMVECTRNGWEVPLEDEQGVESGELQIVWGDDNDEFDPIAQVRQFTVSFELVGSHEMSKQMQNVKQVVPMRLFTAQEIDALARCSGFDVVAMYGALSEEVAVNDDDEAFRLVCILRKKQ